MISGLLHYTCCTLLNWLPGRHSHYSVFSLGAASLHPLPQQPLPAAHEAVLSRPRASSDRTFSGSAKLLISRSAPALLHFVSLGWRMSLVCEKGKPQQRSPAPSPAHTRFFSSFTLFCGRFSVIISVSLRCILLFPIPVLYTLLLNSGRPH